MGDKMKHIKKISAQGSTKKDQDAKAREILKAAGKKAVSGCPEL